MASLPRQLLIDRARIATCDETRPGALGVIDDAAILVRDGRVVFVGPRADLPASARSDSRVIDAEGGLVTPGLVDPHTHLVFAGSRAAEFARKMRGEDYRAIAASGGGILSTVRATRAASDTELRAGVIARLNEQLMHGVTTVEIKSGYALDLEGELRLLAIAKDAAEPTVFRHDGPEVRDAYEGRVVPTLLGAHAVPPEAKDRASYLALVAEQMIPRAAREGLAEACDVYLDANAFSVDESRIVLESAKRHGLRVRAHVGQFADIGGAELVASLGATSADHLEAVSDAGLAAMAAAGTVGVLLPGAWRTLRQAAPDAARMKRLGVSIAVGTDANPGTSPMLDLGLAVALAVRDAGLAPEDALLAITRHAARAIGRPELGVLREGGVGDLCLWGFEEPLTLGYALGSLCPRLVHARGSTLPLALDERSPW